MTAVVHTEWGDIPVIRYPDVPPNTAFLVYPDNIVRFHIVPTRKLRLLHFLLGRTPPTGLHQLIGGLHA